MTAYIYIYNDIVRKKIKLNDYVFVRRSNEVIPEILGVARETDDSKPIQKIEICPSCGAKLAEIGANLFCVNTYHCPEQIKDRITHYASRDAMNWIVACIFIKIKKKLQSNYYFF